MLDFNTWQKKNYGDVVVDNQILNSKNNKEVARRYKKYKEELK